MINFKDYKSILCLNGHLPSVDFFHTSLPIIAADGAANTLMKMGITPQVVIGDLDSIEPQYKNQLNLHLHYDQDYCDFEKTLFYLQEKDLLPAVIVGINGGVIDHILNNINLFITTNSVFYAPPVYGFTLVEPGEHLFDLPFDSKISLIGIPSATITTEGFKWNLQHTTLDFPGKNSCFNQTASPQVKIQLHQGRLLVIIYEKII